MRYKLKKPKARSRGQELSSPQGVGFLFIMIHVSLPNWYKGDLQFRGC